VERKNLADVGCSVPTAWRSWPSGGRCRSCETCSWVWPAPTLQKRTP